jgi:hypothetical protein
MMRISTVILCAGMLLLAAVTSTSAQEKLAFEQHVRPILKTYCLDCHGGGEKLEGNLDLRLAKFAAKGGESGPALVAGDAVKSKLVARMKSGEMPPLEKKVPADKIAVIEQWIAAGAKAGRVEPDQLPPGIDITPEERAFWSFQPVRRPEPPKLDAGADKIRTPIDNFILAKLREKGLKFSAEADKLMLIRRVALDLTGLPPSEPEIAAYLADGSELAYEKMVDQYLASPHYGERWARHWLDVAGYADSEGNGNEDTVRPYIWRYRDYVIRSFNSDKPLNQFIMEQLAGDDLTPRPWNNLTSEQIDKLAATGFLRTAADPTTTGGGIEAEGANLVVADTIKIVSSSLLGLTVGCCQCHDHKYDPIPQSDYFRLRAVFEPALDPAHWRRPGQRLISLFTDADRMKSAAIEAEAEKLMVAYREKETKYVNETFEKELLKFPEDLRPKLKEAFTTPADKRTEEQKKLLAANPKAVISPGVLYQYDMKLSDELKKDLEKVTAKRAEKPVEESINAIFEVEGTIPETKIFHRGDYRQPKAAVLPGDLTILAPEGKRLEIAVKDPMLPTSGRRLAFAKHLTSGEHPLLGRVLANRIWLHHFGRGLVESPGDFGTLGSRPTHPELLDYLASELPASGWSLKKMHKLIMLSSVYRQSSRRDAAVNTDLENSLYSRYPIRRLDAEALRDRILVASGKLDRTLFGKPVPVEEDFVGQVVVKDDQPRRSIYLQTRRTKPVSFLTTFDAPVMTVNCERRSPSTGAQQSLMLMNSEFILKQAGLFAQRVRTETPAGFAKEVVQPLESKFARHADAWQFGYGSYDEGAKRVSQFALLPYFTGSSWQGGVALPDPTIGWVIHHAAGGHAGGDATHMTVRRWVAPQAGVMAVNGKLKHGSPNGDGVRGRIVSSRTGLLGQWEVKNSESPSDAASVEVQPGDTIDFVIDCRGDVNSDSFEWNIDLKLSPAAAVGASTEPLTWNSAKDFHGPLGTSLPQQVACAWQIAYERPATSEEVELGCRFVLAQLAQLRASGDKTDHELTALTSLCQQLLSSNEFLYAD